MRSSVVADLVSLAEHHDFQILEIKPDGTSPILCLYTILRL